MKIIHRYDVDQIKTDSTERASLPLDKYAGVPFLETDTGNFYIHNGLVWTGPYTAAGALGGSTTNEGIETQMLLNATTTGITFSTQITGGKASSTYLATLGANAAIVASATVKIYGSRVTMASALTADRVELAVLTLSGTGVTNNDTIVSTDAVAVGDHFYPFIWAEVTAISGTGAKVQAWREV